MISKTTLIGHTGQDPVITDVRGTKVANFSIATTEKGYIKKDGTKVEDRTEWHRLVCWAGLAGVVEKYVHKGDLLYIEGQLRTSTYEKNGEKRYSTSIFVNELKMLGGKPKENTTSDPLAPYASAPPNEAPY